MAKGKAFWEAQSLSMTSPASRPVLRTTSPKQSALATPTSQSLLQRKHSELNYTLPCVASRMPGIKSTDQPTSSAKLCTYEKRQRDPDTTQWNFNTINWYCHTTPSKIFCILNPVETFFKLKYSITAITSENQIQGWKIHSKGVCTSFVSEWMTRRIKKLDPSA